MIDHDNDDNNDDNDDGLQLVKIGQDVYDWMAQWSWLWSSLFIATLMINDLKVLTYDPLLASKLWLHNYKDGGTFSKMYKKNTYSDIQYTTNDILVWPNKNEINETTTHSIQISLF